MYACHHSDRLWYKCMKKHFYYFFQLCLEVLGKCMHVTTLTEFGTNA
jgi:hypothetical protein